MSDFPVLPKQFEIKFNISGDKQHLHLQQDGKQISIHKSYFEIFQQALTEAFVMVENKGDIE